MKRRDFLITAGMSAAALARLHSRLWAQAGALPNRGKPAAVSPAKLERVSIMTYNFTSVMKLESQPASPDRTLELFDIADMFADTYGVHNVEVQHSHLASTDAAYLKELRARIEKAKSRMTQINVEFGPMTISAADPVQRNQAIDLTMRWVDHAVALNCPRVMINQGQLTPESKARSTVALQAMGEYRQIQERQDLGRDARGGRRSGRRACSRRRASGARTSALGSGWTAGLAAGEGNRRSHGDVFERGCRQHQGARSGLAAHGDQGPVPDHFRQHAHQGQSGLGPGDRDQVHQQRARLPGAVLD